MHTDRPIPVPTPTGFVVKNGSKMLLAHAERLLGLLPLRHVDAEEDDGIALAATNPLQVGRDP